MSLIFNLPVNALVIGAVAVFTRLTAADLFAMFVFFVLAFLFLSAGMYWAHIAWQRPVICARRAATVFSAWLLCVFTGYGYTAVLANVIGWRWALENVLPPGLISSAVAWFLMYRAARSQLARHRPASNKAKGFG